MLRCVLALCLSCACRGAAPLHSVFPNCTAKAKGERQLYIGQQLLEARELGGMVVRRPIDRVSSSSSRSLVCLNLEQQSKLAERTAIAELLAPTPSLPGGVCMHVYVKCSNCLHSPLFYGPWSATLSAPCPLVCLPAWSISAAGLPCEPGPAEGHLAEGLQRPGSISSTWWGASRTRWGCSSSQRAQQSSAGV